MRKKIISQSHWLKFVTIGGLIILGSTLTGCGYGSPEKNEFMKGCKYSDFRGANESTCECAWGRLVDKYSAEYLKAMTQGKIPPPNNWYGQMVYSIQQCINEQS